MQQPDMNPVFTDEYLQRLRKVQGWIVEGTSMVYGRGYNSSEWDRSLRVRSRHLNYLNLEIKNKLKELCTHLDENGQDASFPERFMFGVAMTCKLCDTKTEVLTRKGKRTGQL